MVANTIQPEPAVVRPRATRASDAIRDALPLDEYVAQLLDSATEGLVVVTGPAGSGKSTALRHLASQFKRHERLQLIDIDDALAPRTEAGTLVVLAMPSAPESPVSPPHTVYELSRWGTDEWIEYLLAAHPERCRSVMQRMSADRNADHLDGRAELCRVVLDQMAADDAVTDVFQATLAELDTLPSTVELRRFLMNNAAVYEDCSVSTLPDLDERLLRLFRFEFVRALLVAEGVLGCLERQELARIMNLVRSPRRWPVWMLDYIAGRATDEQREYLRRAVGKWTRARRWEKLYPAAASILTRRDPRWKPIHGANMRDAHLRGVIWNHAVLVRATLIGADLAGASLAGTRLSNARLASADLTGTDLTSAHLIAVDADGADFSGSLMTGANCRAATMRQANFTDATLSRANLQRARLNGARLTGAVLREANLSTARLDECSAAGAEFSDACLKGTRLEFADLSDARLHRVDLSGSNLKAARIAGADLTDVRLCGAACRSIDWREARISGVDFTHAVLDHGNLEDIAPTDVSFEQASLAHCLFTGSRLRHVCFASASLRGAGLAEIDWEGADLRGADLRFSTFHLGTSRSGLVDSFLASEGTRTGFYTDDYDDRYYKQPEEIRQANLCGADLRGAKVDGVDFYLVDLRGARYSAEQAEHFERTGAILS